MADPSSVEFEDSDVIEIVPAEEYDYQRVSVLTERKGCRNVQTFMQDMNECNLFRINRRRWLMNGFK